MRSTPGKAPMGLDPYGPGKPRSLSNDRADPRMVAPVRVCQPSMVDSCRCQLSSFDTAPPGGGGGRVNPRDVPRPTRAPQVNPPAERGALTAARGGQPWFGPADDSPLPPSTSPSMTDRPPWRVITCT